jgi:hypothetical protein
MLRPYVFKAGAPAQKRVKMDDDDAHSIPVIMQRPTIKDNDIEQVKTALCTDTLQIEPWVNSMQDLKQLQDSLFCKCLFCKCNL